MTRNLPTWLDGLTHKDWFFDGSPIRGPVMLAKFANLDWGKSWVDVGPSPMGNMGPYWHVPLKETTINGQIYDLGDTTHRLYPKVLKGKWAALIRHALIAYAGQELKARSKATNNGQEAI